MLSTTSRAPAAWASAATAGHVQHPQHRIGQGLAVDHRRPVGADRLGPGRGVEGVDPDHGDAQRRQVAPQQVVGVAVDLGRGHQGVAAAQQADQGGGDRRHPAGRDQGLGRSVQPGDLGRRRVHGRVVEAGVPGLVQPARALDVGVRLVVELEGGGLVDRRDHREGPRRVGPAGAVALCGVVHPGTLLSRGSPTTTLGRVSDDDLAEQAVALTRALVRIDSQNPGLVPGAAGESAVVARARLRLSRSGFDGDGGPARARPRPTQPAGPSPWHRRRHRGAAQRPPRHGRGRGHARPVRRPGRRRPAATAAAPAT